MRATAEPTPPHVPALHAALLDYFSAPGNYQLALRQPALLFASVRDILQIAAGRSGTDEGWGTENRAVRDAAVFFLRAALLYPGADHYAVLGFAARTEPVQLKERYRLLMRLLHPDFAATGASAWPADAAVRVNRAYEVLSSPVLRRSYDEQLSALRSQRPAPAVKADARRAPTAPRGADGGRRQVNRKAAWALAAGVGLLGILILLPRPEPEGLVQKSSAQPEQPQRLAQGTGQPAPEPVSQGPAGSGGTELAPGLPAAPSAPAAAPPPPAATAPPVPAPAPTAMATAVHTEARRPTGLAAQPGEEARRNDPAPVQLPPATIAAARPTAPVLPPAPVLPAAPMRPAAPVAPLASAAPPAPIAAPQPRPAAVPRSAQAPAPSPAPAIAMAPAAPVLRPIPSASASAPAPAVPAPAPQVAEPAPRPLPSPTVATEVASTAPRLPEPARSVPVAAAAPGPTLADAQPLLTQLLQMLETGSGEQMLRLLEGEARNAPSAQALSRHYEQLVRGARPVRLSDVEFKSEPRNGVLLVTGRIRLHAGEPTIGSHGERILVRAEFVSHEGRVMLKGLSGASD